MSKFDFRDISERLTRSRDTETVVHEFLGYLQSMQSDWRASLAFYEVSRDALVSVYERTGDDLRHREVAVSVDQLPPQLVRKFFHPSAYFNQADRSTLLSHVFQTSPAYEADPLEASALRHLTPLAKWRSCVCLPLADREDILALLVVVSEKKNAFGSRAVGDMIPVKSLAALALAQHLQRGAAQGAGDEHAARTAASEFQTQIRQLSQQNDELRQDNQLKARRLEALGEKLELFGQHSDQYRDELERAKATLFTLEEQSTLATHNMTEAFSQLSIAQGRLANTQRTVEYIKEVFQVLSQEHDEDEFPRTLVSWFCEQFGIERCSLMVLDRSRDALEIAAQRGIHPGVASKVKVRLGQGIAGWVAFNRRPLFVRVRDEAGELAPAGHEVYNSDSFISVPLVHNNKLAGVLNLSNRSDAEPFDDLDYDRALIAAALLAMMLANREKTREAAWS